MKMYKVSTQLNDSYGMESRKNGPDMPHVTVGDKRMTNIPVGNGEFVQGIRRNRDLPIQDSAAPMNCEVAGLKPLRYTAGLTCDPHLESLRPERKYEHPPFQGGDQQQWKQKLIRHPKTYEGSFADADMQNFRPCPSHPDPWLLARLPQDPQSPYDPMMYQDELSQIKARNRRFQTSCAMEYNTGVPMMRGQPMYAPMSPAYTMYPPQPMMMMMPPHPQMMQQPNFQMMQPGVPIDDLSLIDEGLNMTRRATRPYIPTHYPEYNQLQKHIDSLEQEPLQLRKSCEPITSVDQLPPPKKVVKAPLTEALAPPSNKPEVRIADQIAIRSYVLGQNIGKIGGTKSKESSE